MKREEEIRAIPDNYYYEVLLRVGRTSKVLPGPSPLALAVSPTPDTGAYLSCFLSSTCPLVQAIFFLVRPSTLQLTVQWNLLIRTLLGTSCFVLVERLSSFRGDFL